MKVFLTIDGRFLVENPTGNDLLVVSGSSNSTFGKEVTVQGKEIAFPSSSNAILSVWSVVGLLGRLRLAYGSYLVVILEKTLVGTIQSHKVWRVSKGSVLKGNIPPTTLEGLAKYTTDLEIIDQINDLINSGHLYYSNTYDLTRSLQTKVKDDSFWFNRHLQDGLASSADVSPWIIKSICGFASSIDIDRVTNDITKTFTVTLISRLNTARVGTRYLCRGLDENGAAANSVEMEQIVFPHDFLKDKSISSFVQIRGSAPLVWNQELDLSYRPRLTVQPVDEHWSSIKKHFIELRSRYLIDNGSIVCVNLLDDAGFEGPLSDAFEKAVETLDDPKVSYESFPINKWCKKMNFKNMDILLDRIRLRLMQSGFLSGEGDVPALSTSGTLRTNQVQSGIIRTSCLDSLDRTNLTCSLIAKFVLSLQIQSIVSDLESVHVRPTGSSERRDPAADVRKSIERGLPILTNLWADSGDAISLLYAGTRALKSDVTRTGKRQFLKGSVDDGLNSLTRYYLNNFSDGAKQDTYDIWTGKTTSKDLQEIALLNTEKAQEKLSPIIPKNTFTSIIPAFALDAVEPGLVETSKFVTNTRPFGLSGIRRLLGSHQDHLDAKGVAHSVPGFAVNLMKVYSPRHIKNLVEFFTAMTLFFYIFLTVKVFGIKGQNVVSKPKSQVLFERAE